MLEFPRILEIDIMLLYGQEEQGVDMKNWLSKIKHEFRRRVLECHYRIVKFEKNDNEWWEIQRLDITGWKEVGIEYTQEDAEKSLINFSNRFVPPKQTVIKET